MFDFTSANLDKLVIHQVGNKLRDEGIHTSPAVYEMKDGNVEELLLKYFLTSFKDNSLYKFFNETDVHLNELYMRVSDIFIKPETFYDHSINILKHLYEKSSHPQIRGGEFYMAYFKDCIINDQRTDAVGIFKTEKKETYLKITKYANEFMVGSEKCIDVKKLDKGCIVFNVNSEDGYRVAIVDAVNKGGNQALYWKDDFLQLINVQDSYFHTERHLQICKDFAENIYGTVYQADKKDQVAFINEAVAYFDKHSEFQLEDFVQDVLKEPEIIEQFKEHKQNYDLNQGIQSVEQFSISTPAVKTIKRKIKSLIKLDTDFEIKVKNSSSEDGNMQHIERGFDEEKGMNFYKVYFNEEE
ncbi:nucleoid-associated protein [Pelosinus baikalensis]|uniref:Nucleoid-associated protein n=1 Tax=Pelosinus baikalensis TaxID=2892015 RepID=A0ABS8HQV4_9FIRM|nr:nucleoid-associated protein [Pelosinus baikalensis]MCC5465561.1 nucleoid-associated protein [Pelosinus baikalensis]